MSALRSRGCTVFTRAAFTLVELLVVIGIIAVLVGVLLPALRRARESAQRVQCLSNMRQISISIIAFANDQSGRMPSAATWTPLKIDPVTGSFKTLASGAWGSADLDPQRTFSPDWISWQRVQDEFSGATNTCARLNITYSAVSRYLGGKLIETFTPTDDNKVNRALEAIYRCPSDDLYTRLSHADPSHGSYRYSYTMNVGYASPVSGSTFYAYPGYTKSSAGGVRVDGMFTGKISSIRSAGQKILLICEDSKTVSSGSFAADPTKWNNNTVVLDLLSTRHELHTKKANNLANSGNGPVNGEGNQDGFGNVTFCDGHGEFFSRKDALRSKYTGNPNPDPVGF